jgi:hypothetical protein
MIENGRGSIQFIRVSSTAFGGASKFTAALEIDDGVLKLTIKRAYFLYRMSVSGHFTVAAECLFGRLFN